MTYFYYGMRLRGFSLGCQPMNGFVGCVDKDKADKKDWFCFNGNRTYWDIVSYNRKLTDKEMMDYELDYLGSVHSGFGGIEK